MGESPDKKTIIKRMVIVLGVLAVILSFFCLKSEFDKQREKEIGAIINNAMSGEEDKESEANIKEDNPEYIDNFEKAEYEKFNSYAYENGLGGTPICIEGKVLNIGIMNTIIEFTVEQTDGNRWTVGVPTKSDSVAKIIESLIGMNVRVFGTYTGYSDLFNLPAITIGTTEIENTDNARIEKIENGNYILAWSFTDYIMAEMEKQTEESDQNEQQKENVLLYEDNKVKICFIEISKSGVELSVDNLTDSSVTIQARSIAINGISTNSIIMSDDVAPMSIGKVTARCDDFVNVDKIEKISGELRIISDNWDSYSATFSEIEVE